MYKISAVSANRQGDELFLLELEDGSKHEFHIWDYAFLYRYPHLYEQLIVDLLECRVYQAIAAQLERFIPADASLNILDIACGSGLMGRYLHNHGTVKINYLAGIDVIPEAIAALKRDTPDIYRDCYVVGDDLTELKTRQLNCLIICGAANHMRLLDFQDCCTLLSRSAYIVFNWVENKHPEILEWLNRHFELLHSEFYTHRRLANGKPVIHQVFVYHRA